MRLAYSSMILPPLLLIGCVSDPQSWKPKQGDGGIITTPSGDLGQASSSGNDRSGTPDLAVGPVGSGGSADGGAGCSVGQAGLLGLVPGAGMAPGSVCISCHVTTNAATLHVAGTVYNAINEPDGCLGAPDTKVVVTDAQGTPHTLDVNSAGNFVDGTPLGFSMPLQVSVTRNGQTRPMIGAVTNGDCNSCHTAAGASSAPGRVMAP